MGIFKDAHRYLKNPKRRGSNAEIRILEAWIPASAGMTVFFVFLAACH
jgi:hypothetical protein